MKERQIGQSSCTRLVEHREHPNQNQPNPGRRREGSPCIICAAFTHFMLIATLSLSPSLLNQYPLCLLSISIRIGAMRVLRTTRYARQTRPRRHRQKRLQNPQMPTLCRFAASQGFVKSLELRRKREIGKELSVVCIYVLVNCYSSPNCVLIL